MKPEDLKIGDLVLVSNGFHQLRGEVCCIDAIQLPFVWLRKRNDDEGVASSFDLRRGALAKPNADVLAVTAPA